MKKVCFLVILLVSIRFYAQPLGGGGSQGGQEKQFNSSQKIKEFKASDAAGIFYYDESEIVKKLKVKDKDKQYLVKKELNNYNSKIREISFLNSEKFTEINVIVNAAMSSGNREAGMKMRKKVDEIIKPVKEEVGLYEEELNKNMEHILSEKQLKKWLKYQKNKKESLQPKQNKNKSGNSRPTNNRGRGLRN